MPFGWLHSIILFHYFLREYHFWFMLFDLRPLSQEHNYGIKQRLGVQILFETLLAIIM
jgi:hypothetical protein